MLNTFELFLNSMGVLVKEVVVLHPILCMFCKFLVHAWSRCGGLDKAHRITPTYLIVWCALVLVYYTVIPYTKLPIESACLYLHANTKENMFGRKCPIYEDEMDL